MDNQPLISCIVIFFNAGEQFFIEAIESILAQTYKNWELLLVDDGSTDVSTNIALDYVKTYPGKIHYLEHENHQNRGMSATRNLGLQHATGRYVTFLDADDVWLPNTLEEQTFFLEAHPDAAMVYGPIEYWYSWTGKPDDIQEDYIESYAVAASLQRNILVPPPTLFGLLIQNKIGISGMLVRRQILEQVGGFENEFRGLYEDQVFCAKVCFQFSVFAASHCWYRYRQHANSCCAIAEKFQIDQVRLNRLNFLNWIEDYLRQQDAENTEAWQVVQQELWPYRYPDLHSLKERIQSLQKSVNQFKRRIKRLVKKAKTLSPG